MIQTPRKDKDMKDYKAIADSYKYLVAQGKLTQEQAEAEIKIYNFLASCTEDDLCRLINTGAFNSIMWSYVSEACKDAELAQDDIDNVEASLSHLLDTKMAEEIVNTQSDSK